MQKRSRKIGLVLVSFGLAFALLLTLAIPVCEAGPAEKVIKVGCRCCFTGALATTAVPISYGMLDYLRLTNERGGVNGVPIKIMWEDHRSQAVKDVTTHKRFASAGAVAELCVIAASGEFTAPMQQRDQIPLMNTCGMTPAQVTKPIPWVFGTGGVWSQQTSGALKWLKASWTGSRPLRWGGICLDLPEMRASYEGGIPELSGRLGMEYVGLEVMPLSVIDTSVELLRLAAKDVDWIYSMVYGAGLVVMLRDAERLELQKKGIRILGGPQSVDYFIISAARAACEGAYYTRGNPSPLETEKYPGMKDVQKTATEYRGWDVEKIPDTYFAGWFGSLGLVQAITQAIEKVGYENLTGLLIRDSLASIKDFDTGILPYPVSMSNDKPYFVTHLMVCQVRQGEVEGVSDFIPMSTDVELGYPVYK